ncbi:hypothetical protein [Streptomyces sp. NRRL WC-3742]|uniref:hypothetical protein n=1 Tax=Streptomyces sp. NRRL WC-3742 TaxID=1463934 RepID=UPI00131B0C72|nr:hypothetical protein [Streptomyces sp. NRRL WC-3742]
MCTALHALHIQGRGGRARRVGPGSTGVTINTAIRKTVRGATPVVAVAATLVAGLTACGTAKELSAAEKASGAFDRIGEAKSLGVTFSVEATPEQVLAFGRATDAPTEPEAAQQLSGLKLTVAMSADKPLKDLDAFRNARTKGKEFTPDKSLRVSYALADRTGTKLVEYRQVDAQAYLHVDAKGLVKLVGGDESTVDELSRNLNSDLKAARDVLAGKWVTFDLQEFANEAKKSDAAKGGAGASEAPTVDPEASKELFNTLKDVFQRTVTVEDKGRKDGKDHLWVSAPGRQVLDEISKAVKPLTAKFPGQLDRLLALDPTGVPEGKVGVDLYLKDGTLSSVDFDAAQLEPKAGPGVTFPVRLAFDRTSPAVDAPAGATKMSVAEFRNTLMTLAMDGFRTPRGGEFPGSGPAFGSGADQPTPLTDAQLKELSAAGMQQEQAIMYNRFGLTFAEIKEIAQKKGDASAA